MSKESDHPGIRAFIALDVPKHGRETLINWQNQLQQKVDLGSVRWLSESGFHLTLFFLGDGISAPQIEQLCSLIDHQSQQTQPFFLALNHLGCFPEKRRPTVLWAGLIGDLDPLQELKTNIDQALVAQGWTAEKRPFQPHITLGRVNDQMGVVNADLPYGENLAAAEWLVSALHLYRSQFHKNRGIVYTKIHTVKLAPKNQSS
jgi:2'-5' RNA ligase